MQSTRQELIKEDPMRSRESLTELIGNLANQSASLVRDEVALAKQELSEKVASFRSSVVVIAAGAAVGLLATLALVTAAIAGLSVFLDVWLSALIIGLVLAVVAGIVVSTGVASLKRVNLKPEQTIKTLEENKEWLKDMN
jgi:uncharacterized integral membrane protein